MSSTKVNITFTGSASPYTVGDKASFPMHVARGFVKRGVAHFTNPELQTTEKSLKRVRLNEADERPHSVKGQVTSGKDLREYPDEFDMGKDNVNVDDRRVTNDSNTTRETADDDPNTKKHPEELPKLIHPAEGAGRLETLDSRGYSTKVGEKSDADSKVYDAGAKSHAEADARNAGVDAEAAGRAAELEHQEAAARVAKAAADETDFSDKGDKTGHDANLDQETGEEGEDPADGDEDDSSADSTAKPAKAGKGSKRKRTRL